MIYIIIALIIVIVLLLYAIKNLTNKNESYENIVSQYNDAANQIVEWMKISLNKLHEIDRKQIFEGDDDVGWFFKTLKYQITELNNKIAQIFGEEENKNEEKK